MEQLQDTPSNGDESGISHAQYVELLGTMAKIVHRMHNTERELWELKSTRCSKSQKIIQTVQIYIGGVASSVTVEDISAEGHIEILCGHYSTSQGTNYL